MKKITSFALVATVLTGCGGTSPSQVRVESHTETRTSGNVATSDTPPDSGTTTTPTTDTPVAKPADLPAEVVLEATYDGEAKLNPIASGQSLITMLDAALKVSTETPSIGKFYNLMQAKSVKFVSPDIGTCVLSQRNFNPVAADSNSGLTFMGSDTMGGDMACAGFLMTAKSQGMVLEFTDVPVSQISDASIAKVTLKIAPAN